MAAIVRRNSVTRVIPQRVFQKMTKIGQIEGADKRRDSGEVEIYDTNNGGPAPSQTENTEKERNDHKVATISRSTQGVPYCAECNQYLYDVIVGSSYVLSGYLKKKKGLLSGWQRRFFVLIPSHLSYFDSHEDIGTKLPKGVVHLDGVNTPVTDGSDKQEKIIFHVTASQDKRTYNLQAANVDEKITWMTAIRAQGSSKSSSASSVASSSSSAAIAAGRSPALSSSLRRSAGPSSSPSIRDLKQLQPQPAASLPATVAPPFSSSSSILSAMVASPPSSPPPSHHVLAAPVSSSSVLVSSSSPSLGTNRFSGGASSSSGISGGSGSNAIAGGAGTIKLSTTRNSALVFCKECGDYVNMDAFTLAKFDGWLTKLGGERKNWKRRWCALAKNWHLAYYETPEVNNAARYNYNRDQ